MRTGYRQFETLANRMAALLAIGIVALAPGIAPSAAGQTPAESQLIAYQSPFSASAWFGRSSDRNGLQSVGSISVSVEAIFGDVSDSDALIGSPDAPQVFGTRFFATSLAVLDGSHVGESALQPGLVGEQLSDDSAIGMRVRLNYRAANDGGLEISGFQLGESSRSWQRGLGGFDAGDDPTNVRVTASLPLNDGAAGYAVPYDQYFRIGLTTNVCGLGADLAPVGFWWGATLIQPTIGVRYIDMNENFGFAGADSGLEYEHLASGLPVEDTLDPPIPAVPAYQSVLDVTADNQLIGPSLGLNVTTSGPLIRVSSNSRVGAFVADSRQTLAGRGFGNGFAPGFDPTLAFSDTRSQTYGTMFFEQSLNLDIELLRLLPRFAPHQGENSLALRLGWSILAIDSVVRPVESIVWNGFPLTPTLQQAKSEWYLQTWSAGLLFQY